MKVTKEVKLVIGIVIAGALAYLGQYLFSKYVLKDSEGQVKSNVPAMPTLYVSNNGVQTDDYTIRFGNNFFYYSLGDTPRTDRLDNSWSIKFETTQDGKHKLKVTTFQNGNPAFTKIF